MADHGVGRIGVRTPEGPAIVPVNYDVVDGAVVFRTAPGSAPSLAAGHETAFEVDRIDDALSRGWSVLVTGPAARVTDPETVRHLTARAYTTPWAGESVTSGYGSNRHVSAGAASPPADRARRPRTEAGYGSRIRRPHTKERERKPLEGETP